MKIEPPAMEGAIALPSLSELEAKLRGALGKKDGETLREIDIAFLRLLRTDRAKDCELFLDLWRQRYDTPGRGAAPDLSAHYYKAVALYRVSGGEPSRQYIQSSINNDDGTIDKLIKTFGRPF